MKRLLLVITLIICFQVASVFAGPVMAKGGQEFLIVRKGQPQAALVIDTRRYPLKENLTDPWSILERPLNTIAAEVAEYIFKSTGAKLPIVDLATEQLPARRALIYIGRSEYVDAKVGHELTNLHPAGYLIRVVDNRHLIIMGNTAEGTEFGALEFLERFVGIRWLFPTEVGDYIPQQDNLKILSRTNIREEPAFLQVPILAYNGSSHQLWTRRMRFWTQLRFHHQMTKLFPPSQYTVTHPEFFPVLTAGSTQRYLPSANAYNWQPCFTAPGIVDEAAKNIIAYLDGNPRIRSYAFGINDTGPARFCQCEECRKGYIADEVHLGFPSYSDVYYKFVNAVIEKVIKVHPDAWFGCLAYNSVGKPPVNIRLHPRLVPFLTYDTMQLLVPERRKNHEALLRAWAEKSSHLARYDYTYGADHVPPRLYMHHWADYVRWARDHQIKAWYAETNPFFGEGPKYYVMAKIWWNPDREVDAILDEWYRLGFGKAAKPIKAYFDHWENYWTKRVPQGPYFGKIKNAQYFLGNNVFMEQVQPADLDQANAWIARAKQLADTPETKARVEVIARSWEYYETVMKTYLERNEMLVKRLSIDGAEAVLAKKELAPDTSIKALRDVLNKDPLLNFSWEFTYPYKAGMETSRTPFLSGIEIYFDTHHERLTKKLGELSHDPDEQVALYARNILDIAGGNVPNLVPNGSFENNTPLDGWWAGMNLGTGTVRVTNDQAYDGTHAIEITGTFDGFGGVLRTDIPVQVGKRYLYVVRARWQGEAGASTKSQMVCYFRNAAGGEIPRTRRVYTFPCANDWRAYVVDTPVAPEGAVSMAIRAEALSQPKAGHSAYFDALKVYEMRNAEIQ